MQFRKSILLTSKDKNFDTLTEFLAFEFRSSWNYLYINCTIFSILVHHMVRLPSIIISSYNYIFYFDFERHSKTTQRRFLDHFQTLFIDHFTILSPKRCLMLLFETIFNFGHSLFFSLYIYKKRLKMFCRKIDFHSFHNLIDFLYMHSF